MEIYSDLFIRFINRFMVPFVYKLVKDFRQEWWRMDQHFSNYMLRAIEVPPSAALS